MRKILMMYMPITIVLFSVMMVGCGKDEGGRSLSSDFEGRFAFISFPGEQVFWRDGHGSTQMTFDSPSDTLKRNATWIQDGRAIFYEESVACFCVSPSTTWVVNIDSAGSKKELQDLGVVSGITISPDNKHLTSSRYFQDIKIYNLDDDLQPTLMDSIIGDISFPVTWFHNEDKFLFMKPDGIFRSLASYSLATRETTVLFQLPNSNAVIYDYTASFDGGNVAFGYDGNVFILNADGSNPILLPNDSSQFTNLAWSPNNDQLAFTTTGHDPETKTIVVYDISNSVGQALNEVENLNGSIYKLQWSADGQQIAFSFNDGDRTGIFIINSDGTDLRHIHDEYVSNFDWYSK